MANKKRLIDAGELIKRLRRVQQSLDDKGEFRPAGTALFCQGIVNRMPTVDAVPVVRCWDCDNRVYINMGDKVGCVGGCAIWEMALPGDFYCAYGKRGD